jgi:hypothetical protein
MANFSQLDYASSSALQASVAVLSITGTHAVKPEEGSTYLWFELFYVGIVCRAFHHLSLWSYLPVWLCFVEMTNIFDSEEIFDTKVGREDIFEPKTGNESLHDISNDNGVKVLNLATSKNLIVKSTMFPHRNIYTFTWTSPDGKTCNQFNHILINRRGN